MNKFNQIKLPTKPLMVQPKLQFSLNDEKITKNTKTKKFTGLLNYQERFKQV